MRLRLSGKYGACRMTKQTTEWTDLAGKRWLYYTDDRLICADITLLSDGSIFGYSHPNESGWRLQDGKLCFMNQNSEVSVYFSRQKTDGDQRLFFIGELVHEHNFSIKLYLKELASDDVLHSKADKKTEFDQPPGATKIALAGKIAAFGWKIGEHTYGVPLVLEEALANLSIGRFTSIGPNVTIALGDHCTNYLTTYPFSSLGHIWNVSLNIPDHTTKGDVAIGSDVWIGANVFIGSGVTIGDGAIVGANSLVVKDVAAYSIVAGNPSRLLRFRFSSEIIEKLIQISWWTWDDNDIQNRIGYLLSPDIENFISVFL